VLLCLGLDYRRGGFVDRAVAAFSDVLKLDPSNEAALVNLESCRRISISGRRRTSRGSAWRRSPARPISRSRS
jgi:hypothetical protein